MSKLPVSVHVLTWNSAQTLERCLESVRDCAEILVIDGGSTDRTAEIAARFGARMIPQRFPGAQGKPLADFAAARNAGLQHAGQPWILCLDSDEVLSADGLEEIRRIALPDGPPAAYWVPRIYRLDDGRLVTHASTYPNRRIYFFHRDAVGGWEKPVHERVKLKPGIPTAVLRHGSIAPLAPLSIFTSKLAQYLRIEAEQSRGKGWRHWLRRLAHTARSRLIGIIRIAWIRARFWTGTPGMVPLPWNYETVRFWYAWKLVVMTCPLFQNRRSA